MGCECVDVAPSAAVQAKRESSMASLRSLPPAALPDLSTTLCAIFYMLFTFILSLRRRGGYACNMQLYPEPARDC